MHPFNKRHKIPFYFSLILVGILFIQSSVVNVDCKKFRNGKFHFYGKQSSVHFLILRQDSIQREVNVYTNDTSYWKIKWVDHCTYTANYLSGGGIKFEKEKNFLLNHTTFIQIQKTTSDYYIVKGALDSLNSKLNVVDTVWLRVK
jgi:hypothetical protein